MPTIITHSVVAVAAGKAFAPKRTPKRFWFLSVFCSLLPDADVICFSLGIPYSHFFGHRGFFHSLFFAFFLSLFIVSLFFRMEKTFSKRWWLFLFYFFVLSASHGLLDAFTDGGLGIALLSPFDNSRYFSPWTPIAVSPIGPGFFSERGLRVLINESLWVWLPLFIFVIFIEILRSKMFEPADSL